MNKNKIMRFQVNTLLWNLCLPMQNALVYPKNFLKTIKIQPSQRNCLYLSM